MRMKIDVMKNPHNSSDTVRIYTFQKMMEEMTFQATAELARETAKEIAGDIFKKNKKKILAAVDIDLVVAEVQKILLEKIKLHETTPTPHIEI